MKTTLIYLSFLLAPIALCAQNEANIWYFGDSAGLDFNSNPPTVLSNGKMSTQEGCASISDSSGALLFYTDGITVWNANHQIMTNGTGLFGNLSSTQSATIIRKPRSHNIYYIITTPGSGAYPVGHLSYSEVDMSLQNGLGAVTSNKNVSLMLSPMSEKITAISHSNDVDIWIIAQKHFSDSIYVFLVDSTGINNMPIKNGGGPAAGIIPGYMKISFQGNKIARANGSNINIYNFNNQTGVTSPQFTIPSNCGATYGLEFSHNGSRLYYACDAFISEIWQINMDAGSNAQIQNSATLITSDTANFGALQMAPDGNIYCAEFQKSLGVIHDPDSLGLNCNYIGNSLNLHPHRNRYGLPSFVRWVRFPYKLSAVTDTCENDSTSFELRKGNMFAIDSISWDFGDPSTGALNFANGNRPIHVFSAPGTYTIKINIYTTDSTNYSTTTHDTICDSIQLQIHPLPQIDLGSDTILCDGDSLSIQNSNTTLEMDYLWSDSSINNYLPISETGVYWLETSTRCGTAYDTIRIDSILPLSIELGSDTLLCKNQSLILDASIYQGSYRWQDGSTNATYNAQYTGEYWVVATGICANDSDTISIYFADPIEDQLPSDTVFCNGNTAVFTVEVDSGSILWDNGSTSTTYQTSKADTISVMLSNACGIINDTVTVFIDEPLKINLGGNIEACDGDEIELGFKVPNNPTYLWNNGRRDSSLIVTKSGKYTLTITNGCGSYSDEVYAFFKYVPRINFPLDTAVCGEKGWELKTADAFNTYLWQDGTTEPAMQVNESGIYTLQATSDCGVEFDSVKVTLLDSLSVDLGADTSLCLDFSPLLLNAEITRGENYTWNTGSTSRSLTIDQVGEYSVTITDDYGCSTEDAINVSKCPYRFYIPNTFTPNADGLNDLFMVSGEFIMNFHIEIFNRWGESVFQSNNVNSTWDGTYRGKPLPDGIYTVMYGFNAGRKKIENQQQISIIR